MVIIQIEVFIEVTILIYNILEHTNELVITLNAKSKFDKKDKKGIRNTESNDKSSVDNANLTKNSKMLENKSGSAKIVENINIAGIKHEEVHRSSNVTNSLHIIDTIFNTKKSSKLLETVKSPRMKNISQLLKEKKQTSSIEIENIKKGDIRADTVRLDKMVKSSTTTNLMKIPVLNTANSTKALFKVETDVIKKQETKKKTEEKKKTDTKKKKTTDKSLSKIAKN